MILTGYSPVRGTEPVSFDAAVLGVMTDWVAPGKDIIVVDLFGSVIDESGGAWYGMSGSPMYLGDRLVGSVSWVLQSPPSTIVGLTPAEDIVTAGGYGTEPASQPIRFALPVSMVRTIAQATGTPAAQVGGTMTQLRVPLSISGMAGRMGKVSRMLENSGIRAVPFAGSSAPAGMELSAQSLQPGDNFVAALSYGDITAALGGTVTYTCGNTVVAFGHPVLGYPAGPVTLTAHASTSLGLANSPTWGPFKMFTVGDVVGTVNHDGLSGMGATLGVAPPTIPITTHVYSLENDRSRDGTTNVVYMPELPWILLSHLSTNATVVADRSGSGTSDLTFTIKGTRESGDPWMITRTNMQASHWDVGWFSGIELATYLDAIRLNKFEDVTITGVEATGSYTATFDKYKLGTVRVSADGKTFTKALEISVSPGQDVYLRADLKDLDGDVVKTIDLELRVPRGASESGYLYIGGGRLHEEPKASSFDDLLSNLQTRLSDNELAARLHMGSKVSGDLEVLDKVVSRGKTISVILTGGGEGPESPYHPK